MPVTIRSTFTPMTYDEITKPLIQQTEAQQAMEDQYLEANDNASKLLALANQQTDPIAYNRLKNYAADLKMQADNLYAQGLQSGSRNALLNMKRRYSNEIVPIEIAAARREELQKEQRNLQVQNPDLILRNNMYNVSLDQMMANPQLTYGDTYSGAQITQRVGKAVQAATKGIQSIRLGQDIDPYTQTIISETGFSMSDIQNAINDGMSTDNILSMIKDNVLQSTGIQNWGNAEAWERANQYANEGLMYGIKQVEMTPQANFKARTDYQESSSLRTYKKQLEMQNEQGTAATGTDTDASGNTWSQSGTKTTQEGVPVYVHYDENGKATYAVRSADKINGHYQYTPVKETIDKKSNKGGTGSNPMSKQIKSISVDGDNEGGISILTEDDLKKLDNLRPMKYQDQPRKIKDLIDKQRREVEPENWDFYIYEKNGHKKILMLPKTGTAKVSTVEEDAGV